MSVFESRQDGHIRGIEDARIGADQPVQAMGARRDRHDPFIAYGNSLVDGSILGHGVNSARPDQQLRQTRKMRRRGRKRVLVHHLFFLIR